VALSLQRRDSSIQVKRSATEKLVYPVPVEAA
jgi:hypothetical protein